MYARPFIDSSDFARNGQKISGEVQVAELPRLQDMLESRQGVLGYTVQGGVDRQGMHFLDIGVNGCCRLRCQRCLDGLEYPVRIETRLLLRNQAELDALDNDATGGEDEQFDSILTDTHLDVLDFLEQEILLSLPISPKHEPDVCQAAGGGDIRGEQMNPFAVLEKLKFN